MKNDLVSIITPCYNGEKFLDRYFKSILNQTYKNIELIFIDDGSTDSTKSIVEKYKREFENQNISFTYIYQENAGQAAAVNKGIKIFKGEYLIWPDSDDYLEKDAIEKEVEFLKRNLEYDIVRIEVNIIDEDTKKVIGEFKIKNPEKSNIFEDLLFENNVFFAPVSYMIRTNKFLEVNPKREIFESRYGQNWQMLLPITYKYKCGCIKEKLASYYVRKQSHSRKNTNSIEEKLLKLDGHKKILEKVLSEMNLYNKYLKKIEDKYNIEKMNISLANDDIFNAKRYSGLIIEKKSLKKKEKIKIAIINNVLLFYIYKVLKKIKNITKGKE